MEREKRYSKEEIIKKLKEIGAEPRFLKMPAVIERLYGSECNINELEVDSKGNIYYRNTLFEKRKDGKARRYYLTDENFQLFLYLHYGEFEIRDDGVVKTIRPLKLSKNESLSEVIDEENHCIISEINKYGIEVKMGEGNSKRGIYNNEGVIERFSDGSVSVEDSVSAPTILGFSNHEYFKDYYAEWTLEGLEYDRLSKPYFRKKDNTYVMGHLLEEYPETEEWMVQSGFLPENKQDRNIRIVDIMQRTKNEYIKLLEKNREYSKLVKYKLSQKNIDTNYYLGEKEKNQEIIENLERSIERFDKLSNMYAKGERPAQDVSYTQEQAEQNRSNNLKNKIKELENKTKASTDNLFKLQELARRCRRIPFAGIRVTKILKEQMIALQEGKLQYNKSDTNIDELYKEYVNTKERYIRNKEAYSNLKESVLKCAKIPFIGKRILKEMNNMLTERNKNNMDQR